MPELRTTRDRCMAEFVAIAREYGLEVDDDGNVIYFRRGLRTFASIRLNENGHNILYSIKGGGIVTAGWQDPSAPGHANCDFKDSFDKAFERGFVTMFETTHFAIQREMTPIEGLAFQE